MTSTRLAHARVLVATLSLAACSTEPTSGGRASNLPTEPALGTLASSCALVRNQGQQGYLETFQYNANGLVEVYHDLFGAQTRFGYDAQGRLATAVFDDGDQIFDVVFEYSGGRIARELTTDAATGDLVDEVVNSYDAKGRLVRRESLDGGFYATFAYDRFGNANQVDVLGTDGYLFIATTYQFTREVRDPHRTLRGLPYNVPFINSAINPWRQTAAKSVITDAEGGLLTLYDQDPARSILRTGADNYATFQSFFDKLSSTYYTQRWEYEGCAGGTAANVSVGSSAPMPGSALPVRGSRARLTRHIDALRQAYGR